MTNSTVEGGDYIVFIVLVSLYSAWFLYNILSFLCWLYFANDYIAQLDRLIELHILSDGSCMSLVVSEQLTRLLNDAKLGPREIDNKQRSVSSDISDPSCIFKRNSNSYSSDELSGISQETLTRDDISATFSLKADCQRQQQELEQLTNQRIIDLFNITQKLHDTQSARRSSADSGKFVQAVVSPETVDVKSAAPTINVEMIEMTLLDWMAHDGGTSSHQSSGQSVQDQAVGNKDKDRGEQARFITQQQLALSSDEDKDREEQARFITQQQWALSSDEDKDREEQGRFIIQQQMVFNSDSSSLKDDNPS